MKTRSIRAFLFALVVLSLSAAAFAQVRVAITIGPPPIPVYEQPVCPGDGYIWTPGYWAYGDDFDDYYWVPGTWVPAPEVGLLWTPGYWGWNGEGFIFYEGYWGPVIGFYGGINYGFGYFGEGYEGGRWDRDHFYYNRAVTNVNTTNITNVYNTTVINKDNGNRVSYNGGNGGINAKPTPEQQAAAAQKRSGPVAVQTQHVQEARSNPQQRASMNRGKPEVAATAKPAEFKGAGVVQAKAAGGAYTPRPAKPAENQPRSNEAQPNGSRPSDAQPNGSKPNASPMGHIRDLPPAERPAAPNTGNPKADKQLQQEQEKQYQAQQKERQKLQQQQEKEDQQLQKKNTDDAKRQQVEQRHQQETQQLQQKHEQERQQLQQRIAPPPSKPEEKRPQ